MWSDFIAVLIFGGVTYLLGDYHARYEVVDKRYRNLLKKLSESKEEIYDTRNL